MAVYTELTLRDINELLQYYDVGCCVSFSALTAGITNSNLIIQTDQKRYVLTLFEAINDVSFLAKIYTSLSSEKFPVAELMQPKNKEIQRFNDKPILLFEFVEGASVKRANAQHCQIIGHFLAVLHSTSMDSFNELNDDNSFTQALNKAVDLLATDISDDDADIITAELDYFRRHKQLSLPTGLIHADCFRDNVLFDEQSKEPILSAMLDFEEATIGTYVYDLAIVINDWCSHDNGSLDRLKMRDVIAAYHHVRPLSSMENQAIPFMLRAAAFRFWVSRLVSQRKDPDEFKRILLQRRQSLSGMQNH